uniref:AMP-dependent synthetase/ligase domain-containing protein n=1 Tax=Stomoxys calcitrans TaxID=35570 RepID=A0A1I8PAA8_STOCA
MKMQPSKVIQIDDFDGTTVTNKEMLTYSISIAKKLKKLGMRQEDLVGVAAHNTTYLTAVTLGCFFNCTPFHTVHPDFKEVAMAQCFDLTKPKIIFCEGSNYKTIVKITADYSPKLYTLSDHLKGVPTIFDLLQPTENDYLYQPETPSLGAEQTVAILCSSGTTGLPKAVTLSAYRFMLNNPLINGDTVFYCPSTLDWMSGLMGLYYNCLSSCTRIISRKAFSPDYFVQLTQKYKITYTIMSPINVIALTECPQFTCDKMATLLSPQCIGGPISQHILRNFQKIVPKCIITRSYGCSETGGISINIGLQRENSAGKLLPNVQLRIVDDKENNLGPNDIGEILVHLPYQWGGYFGNTKETEGLIDALGWCRTGDIGLMDGDCFLYIVDRKKDVLKYLSMHYWPGEIENTIRELPQVDDCCVVGIYDEHFGDVAGALVVKQKDSKVPTAEMIISYVKERLVEPEKQLHNGVYFIEELPRNNNGKVLRPEAKEIFRNLMQTSSIDYVLL